MGSLFCWWNSSITHKDVRVCSTRHCWGWKDFAGNVNASEQSHSESQKSCHLKKHRGKMNVEHIISVKSISEILIEDIVVDEGSVRTIHRKNIRCRRDWRIVEEEDTWIAIKKLWTIFPKTWRRRSDRVWNSTCVSSALNRLVKTLRNLNISNEHVNFFKKSISSDENRVVSSTIAVPKDQDTIQSLKLRISQIWSMKCGTWLGILSRILNPNKFLQGETHPEKHFIITFNSNPQSHDSRLSTTPSPLKKSRISIIATVELIPTIVLTSPRNRRT